MPLRSIIVVVLRIFALQWIFTSLFSLIPIVAAHMSWSFSSACVVWILLAVLFWFFAEPFSRWITQNHDTTVSLGGLTLQDLYAFAFVFLGLSFFVSGIGTVVVTVATMFANGVSHPTPQTTLLTSSLPQIGKSLIQSLLGLIALFNANRFAKRLVSREE